jgi:hypothetical protein
MKKVSSETVLALIRTGKSEEEIIKKVLEQSELAQEEDDRSITNQPLGKVSPELLAKFKKLTHLRVERFVLGVQEDLLCDELWDSVYLELKLDPEGHYRLDYKGEVFERDPLG